MDRIHYQKYANIFLYVTSYCQLRCKHCYMGDRLNHPVHMEYEFARSIIYKCRNLGAEFLTLIGGEPTLYPYINELIYYANSIGYKKITIDTNASFPEVLELDLLPNCTVQISIDGACSNTHDYIRGKGAFSRTVSNIIELKKKSIPLIFTATINQMNINEIDDIIHLAEDFEVNRLNIHVLSEEGEAVNNPELSISPHQWIDFCHYLDNVDSKIEIWYPPTWILKTNMDTILQLGYKGCLGFWEDRLSIFPDGKAYICSVMFDHNNWVFRFTDNGILLNREENEYEQYINAMSSSTDGFVCPAIKTMNTNKHDKEIDYLPVCRCWKVSKDGVVE